jgi:hypothetical protein
MPATGVRLAGNVTSREEPEVRRGEVYAARAVPAARTDDLVVTEAAGEVLAYDTKKHQIHQLNGTAATVWRLCDGRRSAAELEHDATAALGAPVSRTAVYIALGKLEEAGLLSAPLGDVGIGHMTRRRFLHRLALAGAVAVPAVVSVSAPAAAFSKVCSRDECYEHSNCSEEQELPCLICVKRPESELGHCQPDGCGHRCKIPGHCREASPCTYCSMAAPVTVDGVDWGTCARPPESIERVEGSDFLMSVEDAAPNDAAPEPDAVVAAEPEPVVEQPLAPADSGEDQADADMLEDAEGGDLLVEPEIVDEFEDGDPATEPGTDSTPVGDGTGGG